MPSQSDPVEVSSVPQRKSKLPCELLGIIGSALQFGGVAGVSGFVVGGFAGVLRSSTPFLFALASGIQWATLGTSYWASRGAVLHAWSTETVTPDDRISASAIAGGISGICGGALRARANILPGLAVFSLIGGLGQKLYNVADARNTELVKSGIQQDSNSLSWLTGKWSPMQRLTNEQYEGMIREKLLRVDVEIALVEEKIAGLKKREKEEAKQEAEAKVSK